MNETLLKWSCIFTFTFLPSFSQSSSKSDSINLLITVNIQDCPDHCEESQGGVCNKCESGYYLSDNECLSCKAHCMACELSSKICTACETGYYSSGWGFCDLCDSSCLTCNNFGENSCTSCPSGSFLNDEGYCCDNSCVNCNDSGCTSCRQSGYFVDMAKCVKCPDGCSECSDNFYCKACEEGYSLKDYSCLSNSFFQNDNGLPYMIGIGIVTAIIITCYSVKKDVSSGTVEVRTGLISGLFIFRERRAWDCFQILLFFLFIGTLSCGFWYLLYLGICAIV